MYEKDWGPKCCPVKGSKSGFTLLATSRVLFVSAGDLFTGSGAFTRRSVEYPGGSDAVT